MSAVSKRKLQSNWNRKTVYDHIGQWHSYGLWILTPSGSPPGVDSFREFSYFNF